MSTVMKTSDPIQNLLNQVNRRKPFAQLRATALALGLFTLICGIIYPLLVTGLAQIIFPIQANGSLLRDSTGSIRGSRLLAQDFTGDEWFQARPSVVGYAAGTSGASNLAITSLAQDKAIAARNTDWSKRFGSVPAPRDMLYASGSGLDPEISLESALAQFDQIATFRKLTPAGRDELKALIMRLSQNVVPGEEPRVNVVDLNFALFNGMKQ